MNWKDMGDGSFPLVESNLYTVRIVEVKRGLSAKKQSPQLEVKATIIEGPLEGMSLMDRLSLVEAAAWRIGQALLACGMSTENIKALPVCDDNSEEFTRITNMLKGRVCVWDVTQDTYQGTTRNKVSSWAAVLDADQGELTYEDNVPDWVKSKTKKAGLI
jgi:hypothetical protein